MASSRHAADGLMRAVWRARDIREGREADWTFLPDDVTAMAARAGDAQAR
jgi:hypothetical protein